MPTVARREAAVWLVGAATAFSLLGDQALYSTLPIYFEELGLRPFEVGIVLSANRWIRLATNELAHRLTTRGNQHLLFVAAVGLGAVVTAAYATTPGFVFFVAVRMMWGLCWSFIRHLGILSVLTATGHDQAGRSAGRLSGIGRIGSVGGLLGGALVVDWLGFGPAMLVLAALSTVAVPLAWFGFVEIVEWPAKADGKGEVGRASWVLGFAHGMVGPGLVLATLGAVIADRVTASGWLSAASLTGGVLALRFVLESTAAARLGALFDQRGVRVACSGAFAIGSVALVVAALSPSLVVLVLAVVAFFVSGTALGAGLTGYAGREGSRALARFATASDLGSASGPALGWIALGLFDQPTLGLGLGAIIYGLGAFAALRWLGAGSPSTDRQEIGRRGTLGP
ncbi:MAG: MFS transporter [Actinomycetia bacterium]|nr:MFS transporter [Actinomycetes bacterium]